jgi:hypothetical protein
MPKLSALFLDLLPTVDHALTLGALTSALFFALYASLARQSVLMDEGIEDDAEEDPDGASLHAKVYFFCFVSSVLSAALVSPAATTTTALSSFEPPSVIGSAILVAAMVEVATAAYKPSVAESPSRTSLRAKLTTSSSAATKTTSPETSGEINSTSACPAGSDHGGATQPAFARDNHASSVAMNVSNRDDEAMNDWRDAERALFEHWDDELRARSSSNHRRRPP